MYEYTVNCNVYTHNIRIRIHTHIHTQAQDQAQANLLSLIRSPTSDSRQTNFGINLLSLQNCVKVGMIVSVNVVMSVIV